MIIDIRRCLGACGLAALVAFPAAAQMSAPVAIPLDRSTRIALTNTRAEWVEHQGRPALHLAPLAGHERDTDQEMFALLTDTDFGDGAIEVDVSGARRTGYGTDNVSAHKGHIGISFRAHGDSAERFYVRPENAVLDDQVFRNRSVQYESAPAYPFNRLRQEAPEVYESYAPMEPGKWTHLRIEVAGTKARVYVNGATQPTLIVNDLKNGMGRGRIALWTRISTDAYFSNLRVEKR
jgi:3-keto-disaccharide hydrolase